MIAVSSKVQSVGLLLLLGLVLALAIADLGGQIPQLANYDPRTGPDAHLKPVDQLTNLFNITNWSALTRLTNANPFFTTDAQTTPAEKTEPAKKIELAFQGVYQTANGQRLAFLKIGDTLATLPAGTTLEGNLVLSEVGFDAIVVTDPAGQSHQVKFNTKKTFEIPN